MKRKFNLNINILDENNDWIPVEEAASISNISVDALFDATVHDFISGKIDDHKNTLIKQGDLVKFSLKPALFSSQLILLFNKKSPKNL